jgi:hypothetical protein
VSKPALALGIDADALRPLVEAVVEQVLARLDGDRARVGDDRLAFSEGQAAELLGWHRHQLRDLRLAGGIGYSKGPGGRIYYQRSDLIAYLTATRVEPGPQVRRA